MTVSIPGGDCIVIVSIFSSHDPYPPLPSSFPLASLTVASFISLAHSLSYPFLSLFLIRFSRYASSFADVFVN